MIQPITEELQVKPTQKMESLSPEQVTQAIELLNSWIEVSDSQAQEQQETGEYLLKVLEQDRLSNRPLFP